jgi:Leucine-rich repeat (LRR) protein
MSTLQSDQELVAIIAEKISIVPTKFQYDENGRLISLELSDLALSQLPPEIWLLINLQELRLGNNQLSQLPAEVGRLTHLQELYLGNNQLSQLPAELWQLTSLRNSI